MPFASAWAETIDGVVTDADGRQLVGVNITVGGVHYQPTDEQGEFSIDLTDPKGKSVTFSHVGYRPIMVKIREQETMSIKLERSVYRADGITVHATRVDASDRAAAVAGFSQNDIERDYYVGEFPLLLDMTPNVYSYADAGGGLGSSYLKIRGFDSKRVSIYINGIPLNDPEDHVTYFYDIPDFASEVRDIQIERGVGSSLYGDASFGGSVNIVSSALDRQKKVTALIGYGGYMHDGKTIGDIRKQAFEYSSGLIDGRWSFAGRYSKLWSDGYRKSSWYDAWTYFLSVSRLDPKMATTLNIYGGPMRMHMAFYGNTREKLEEDRRYNLEEYENETDNFNQPHYELHNIYQINDRMTLSNTLYYIRGRGYYEQLKTEDFDWVSYSEYNIPPIVVRDTDGTPYDTITGGDLVRQKWVVKNQYGFNPRLDIKHESGKLSIGGAFYLFDSEHWGQVVWAENVNSDLIGPRHKYYEYFGDKFSGAVYASENYQLSDRVDIDLSLQTRYIRYSFKQTPMGAFDKGYNFDLDWLFVSPRAGVSYRLNEHTILSTSAAISSRTPTDESIYEADDSDKIPSFDVKPERVYDFELGGSYRQEYGEFGVNFYWMEFRNEIIAEGGYDSDGNIVTVNADRSVHAGVEITARANPLDYLALSGNLAVTYDRAKDFVVTKKVYDNDSDWGKVGYWDFDYSGNPISGFPIYLGNLLADFQYDRYRIAARSRFVGRQYVDNGGNRDSSIDPYATFSLSASVALANPAGFGRLMLSGRVDNLFNEKYELVGVVPYAFRDVPDPVYYTPAAERSFFVQVKLELD
jgi:iron complex outermembrane receptor protein